MPLTIGLTGNQLVFSWPSAAGGKYQLEYKTNLTDPSWLAESGPFSGTGSSLMYTNSLGAWAQRFFRLKLLP
jgi:hypothetical protein